MDVCCVALGLCSVIAVYLQCCPKQPNAYARTSTVSTVQAPADCVVVDDVAAVPAAEAPIGWQTTSCVIKTAAARLSKASSFPPLVAVRRCRWLW